MTTTSTRTHQEIIGESMAKPAGTMQGTLLVAGTAIGGGMLALPILTGQAGFFPSLLIYLACWLFMSATGLLFLEISLWMDRDANIISMADRTLGFKGKVAAWGIYLFLFYCLTLAYIVGSGNFVVEMFRNSISQWQGQLIFLLLFAPFVYLGSRATSRLNVMLMVGLGISYFLFVSLGVSYVNPSYLFHANWTFTLAALPITFTAFAYQGIIPTLVNDMRHDTRKIRLAILIGSFLPFIAYAIWQWLILGIVPIEGSWGILETKEQGQNAVYPLKNLLNTPNVYFIGQSFAFFALVTSFFGVTLGLVDFLADGLKVKKSRLNRLFLCLLVFIPPFLFAIVHPHVFLIALDYAGGFGCALLLGLMPVLMVWAGRYRLGLKSEYRLWGGRPLLVLLVLFVILELVCQFAIMGGLL